MLHADDVRTFRATQDAYVRALEEVEESKQVKERGGGGRVCGREGGKGGREGGGGWMEEMMENPMSFSRSHSRS
jgi:hypothetical protein